MFTKNLAVAKCPFFLCESDRLYYEKCVVVNQKEAVFLCSQTTGQACDLWSEERHKRITGSKCYQLFTYSRNKNPDWNKKIEKMNVSTANENMKYGLIAENIARNTYIASQKCDVLKLGLIVHQDMPWLGYSPDGIVVKDESTYLLEIKCPVAGQQN